MTDTVFATASGCLGALLGDSAQGLYTKDFKVFSDNSFGGFRASALGLWVASVKLWGPGLRVYGEVLGSLGFRALGRGSGVET